MVNRQRVVSMVLVVGLLALPVVAQAQSRGYEQDPSCPIPFLNRAESGFHHLQEEHGPAQFPAPEPFRMVMIPVDFDNREVTESAAEVIGDLPDRLVEDLAVVSEGNARAEVLTADRVYRMPQPLGDPYATTAQVLEDAMVAADDDIDFSDVDVVHVILAQGDTDLTEAVSYADINHGLGVAVDGRTSMFGVRYGTRGYDRLTVLHEVLHLFGAPDVYTQDPDDSESAMGGWSIMRAASYDHLAEASILLNGWDQLRMGWFDLADRVCVDEAGSHEVTLTPLADGDGVRVVQVPVDGGDHVLLELRVPGALDSQICEDGAGVLAYRHHAQVESGEGIYQVVDATPGSITYPGDDARCQTDVDDGQMTAATGPLEAAPGITVEVLTLTAASATVRVTRDADAEADPLTTADGSRRMVTNPLSTDGTITPRIGDFGVAVNQAWEVSNLRFRDDEAAWVVLTRDDAFADALAGTSLLADGPMLLLNGTDAIDDFVLEELERVLPDGGLVYLLGGEAAASPAVQAQVAGLGYEVRRLSGPSRIETAAAIAAEVQRRFPGSADRVLVARARGEGSAGWADAVTVGGWAARFRVPLVLTDSPSLSGGLDGVLAGASTAVVVGGEAAVASGVVADLEARGLAVDRVAGASRDGTAAAVTTDLWGGGPGRFMLINGYEDLGWATGLPAAGLSADLGAPLLVVQRDGVPPATAEMLTTCEPGTLDTVLLATSEQVLDEVLAQVESLDGACR